MKFELLITRQCIKFNSGFKNMITLEIVCLPNYSVVINNKSMLIIFIMLQQLISSKIIFQIPDHCVNMIGIVLYIIIFNDNCRALDTVIMRMTDTGLLISRPGKPKIIKTRSSISFIIPSANNRV